MRLILVAALLFQDTQTLVERLGADDVTVRERATAELESRGTAVLPSVEEAARSRDPEIAERARAIAARIREAELRRRLVPAPKRVTLVGEDLIVAEALRRVAAQTGYALEPSKGLEERRLGSLRLKDVTYGEAIQHLLEHGRAYPIGPYPDGRLLICEGEQPRRSSARGPLLLEVDTAVCATLGFGFRIEPAHVHAVGLSYTIVEARRGDESPLQQYEGRRGFFSLRSQGVKGGWEYAPSLLRRFRVDARLFYAAEWETLTLRPNPEEQVHEWKGVRLTYGFGKTAEGGVIRMNLSGEAEANCQDALDRLHLLGASEIELLERDGKPIRTGGGGIGFSPLEPDVFRYWASLIDSTGKQPIHVKDVASVRLRAVSKWVSCPYSFDLRDVRFSE